MLKARIRVRSVGQVELPEAVAEPPRLLHRRVGPQPLGRRRGPPRPASKASSPASRRIVSPSRPPSRWMSALECFEGLGLHGDSPSGANSGPIHELRL